MNLTGALLEGASLEGANMVGGRASPSLLSLDQRAQIHSTTRYRCQLEPGSLEFQVQKYRPLGFSQCVFPPGTTLAGLWLADTNFQDAVLTEVDLRGADLYHANLKGAHLEGALLHKAKLFEAVLEGAHLEGAHLVEANLYQANLTGAHLQGAFLQDADLRYATLTGAQWDGATWDGAKVAGTTLDSTPPPYHQYRGSSPEMLRAEKNTISEFYLNPFPLDKGGQLSWDTLIKAIRKLKTSDEGDGPQ